MYKHIYYFIVFQEVMRDITEQRRIDKRLLHSILDHYPETISIDRHITFEDFRRKLFQTLGLDEGVNNKLELNDSGDKVVATLESSSSSSSSSATLQKSDVKAKFSDAIVLLEQKRPGALAIAFKTIQDSKIADYKEEEKKIRRREERYIDLLKEHFYRSDHVNVDW